jgi:hypothetical protein
LGGICPGGIAGSSDLVKILIWIVSGVAVLVMTAWTAGAIYYSPLSDPTLRAALAAGFVLLTVLAFALNHHRGVTLLAFLLVFGVILALWFQIPASNDRNWETEVSVLPFAAIDGDNITVHGIRNFNYRTETDFDPRWEDRNYKLSDLDSADLIAVYWAGKAIAHIMLSFGFHGKDHLAVSIETRKEKGEGYSTIGGFFRQYELYYVVADERDVIRVRTNYRQPQEDVYVYRLRVPVANIRRVFLDYMRSINELHEHPAFYNTLTTNCTTTIYMHSRVNPGRAPISWKVLLSGYVPEYLYELKKIDTARPFADLERMSRVNDRAHAADQDPQFSKRIREGLPVPQP